MSRRGHATAPTPGGTGAPEVLEFTCNGSASCTVAFDEDFAMSFRFSDPDGNASAWRITAVREDGASFLIDERPIVPPPAGETITRYTRLPLCGRTDCPTTAFDLRIQITDATNVDSEEPVSSHP